jgi:hypothetical protein
VSKLCLAISAILTRIRAKLYKHKRLSIQFVFKTNKILNYNSYTGKNQQNVFHVRKNIVVQIKPPSQAQKTRWVI